MSAKRFGPLGTTAPTAGEALPAVTKSVRPDADPFQASEAVTPKPRDAQKPSSPEVVTPENHEAPALRALDAEKAIATTFVTSEPSDAMNAPLTDAETAIIQKLLTPRRREVKKEDKVAFTWRISLDQADMLDEWARDFRRKLGRGRLDRSELLAAIVDEVSGRQDVLDAVASRLQNP